ncbi:MULTISPECIES: HAD-IA family hydrolase [Pantoea]|uniref:Uncharacterized protein n=2 Tax=Pantoea TaxID=53335 RepID=A0A0U3JQP3_9GAMM|nr:MULTISPECIES: HAD-IA family hydrolase [Pantoea]ALV91150.1 hypothetical protein LK04_02840 [Pantoea vagans]KHJ67589.1 hypothetical protein QU24_13445 [Pantoea rodasii]
MKILFYINPFFVRGNPAFYDGAIKKKIAKQAAKLYANNCDIYILTNEYSQKLAEEQVPFATIIPIKQCDISNSNLKNVNVEKNLYENCFETELELKKLLRDKIPLDLDCIISWETPIDFLKHDYPNTLLVHQMPGFLSRVPFPELLTFDSEGLFNKGKINSDISNYKANPKSAELLGYIRNDLLSFIEEHNPFERCELDPESEFEKLILLPLQITDQYSFLSETNYKNQLDLMIDVLSNTPTNIGVIVTQYKTGSTAEEVINEENYQDYKNIYPNLIWSESFSLIDNSSQYLISSVDAVVTVSSSIGIQALLWNKPLISICNNYLNSHSDYKSLTNYAKGIENKKEVETDLFLKWLLSSHQPLVSLLFESSDFLIKLLEKIKTKNNNYSFYDLDEDYNNHFRNAIKKDIAESIIRQKFTIKSTSTLVEKFKSKISELKPNLISFDIFDTLVDRKVEQPAHIFSLIERKVEKLTFGKISNFCTIRQSSERYLREKLSGGMQEITLQEIYAEIERRSGISKEQTFAVKELEISEELKSLDSRLAGRKLFDAACKTNAKIILISDMYLDNETISKILHKSNYPSIKLYLSSDIGLRKHEGDLFDYVSNLENVDHKKWLHVGDNTHGDIKIPASKGIQTFHIKSAFRNIETNEKLFNLIKPDRKTRSLAESAIYGLIQKKYFDDPTSLIPSNTHVGGDAYKLGYIAIAPLMFGFLQWIMTQAKRDGVDQLLFLSRDAQVLYRMANVLFPIEDGWPEIKYALSSRRSARVASIFHKGDISELIDSAISNCKLNEFFSGKFGFDIFSTDVELIHKHGFNSFDQQISHLNREQLRELSYDISNEIIAAAKKEREHLRDYYVKLGVTEKNSIGLVDIGYAGTMQAALEKITDAEHIKGYYYITFESALNQLERTGSMRGYAGEFVKRQIHSDPICHNGFLYETIFCSSDSSFIAFKEKNENHAMPTFINNSFDYKRRGIVDKIHNACVSFARDLRSTYDSDVSSLLINSITASKIFNDFIINPSGRDAEIFEGCIFEDAFSGSKLRYIVPPRNLIIAGKLSPGDFIWREGTAVFSRRPDIKNSDGKPVSKIELKNSEKSKILNSNLKHSLPSSNEANKRPNSTQSSSLNATSKKRRRESIEIYLVNKFVKSTNKKNKYFKNRESFFKDSKSRLISLYWNKFGKSF